LLSISNLHVSVGEKPILTGLTLEVPMGEIHAKAGLGRGIIEKSGLISLSRTF
jgi:Fe-S cluster assembly ATPase SufC